MSKYVVDSQWWQHFIYKFIWLHNIDKKLGLFNQVKHAITIVPFAILAVFVCISSMYFKRLYIIGLLIVSVFVDNCQNFKFSISTRTAEEDILGSAIEGNFLQEFDKKSKQSAAAGSFFQPQITISAFPRQTHEE